MGLSFTAIDFETAYSHHICAVGIVVVEDGLIVDEYYRLVKPPGNFYNWYHTRVHGITAKETLNEPKFIEIYPEIRQRLTGRRVVAHNSRFDRNVLYRSMAEYGIRSTDLGERYDWHCTVQLYRKKYPGSAKLSNCCSQLNIPLNHHHALSDAKACALLYLKM